MPAVTARVRRDLINGHDFVLDDRNGTLTRAYRVDGLTSSAKITDDALQAVDSTDPTIKVPQIGDPHESIPDMQVRKVHPESIRQSKTAIRVIVTYAKVNRRLLDIRFGGVSQQTTTNRDIHGKIMVVGYLSPDSIGGKPVDAATIFPDPSEVLQNSTLYKFCYVQVPFLLPDASVEFVFMEQSDPFTKWFKYGRRLNATAWQGGQAREWLCESIGGQVDSPIAVNKAELEDPTKTGTVAIYNWINTYRFRFLQKPTAGLTGGRGETSTSGWDPLAIFVDQQVGRTPLDVDPKKGGWPDLALLSAAQTGIYTTTGIIKGNGWAQFKIYGEAEFGDLKMPQLVVAAAFT